MGFFKESGVVDWEEKPVSLGMNYLKKTTGASNVGTTVTQAQEGVSLYLLVSRTGRVGQILSGNWEDETDKKDVEVVHKL